MYINSLLYLKSKQCPRLFYMDAMKNKKPHANPELRHYIHEYIRPCEKVLSKDEDEAFLQTKQYLDNHVEALCDATFIADHCCVTVDSVKQNDQGLILYIVKSGTKLTRDNKLEAAFIYYVVKNCGYNISSLYVLTVNSQYIRYGDVDARLLFSFHDLTMDCFESYKTVGKDVKMMNAILSSDIPDVEISTKCLSGFGCSYKSGCFENIPEYSIFNLSGLSKQKMLEYYDHGIISYEDILKNKIPLDEKQILQIESYVFDKEPYINERRVSYFMNSLSYPLYFLDFETFQTPVPQYEGCHAYQSIPFQYSLHYKESAGSEVKHTYFLGNGVDDPRYELAKKLCEDIPKGACILAYNNALEKSVVMHLAILFQEFRDQLLDIYTNINDLEVIFDHVDYYHKDMHGSHSLKNVLPALCPELNYNNLDSIHNGTEAMMSYIKLARMDEQQREEVKKHLLEYCDLDTYAMVKIHEKIEKDLKNIKN